MYCCRSKVRRRRKKPELFHSFEYLRWVLIFGDVGWEKRDQPRPESILLLIHHDKITIYMSYTATSIDVN